MYTLAYTSVGEGLEGEAEECPGLYSAAVAKRERGEEDVMVTLAPPLVVTLMGGGGEGCAKTGLPPTPLRIP